MSNPNYAIVVFCTLLDSCCQCFNQKSRAVAGKPRDMPISL